MKQIPILFSTRMVQAILDGRKTMTRRVVKPQPNTQLHDVKMGYWSEYPEDLKQPYIKCRYGEVGDVLWVRETFVEGLEMNDSEEFVWDEDGQPKEKTWYKADNDIDYWWCDGVRENVPWKPSIHMPKAAARIWLQVTDVRVERLHQITEEDAVAEGIERVPSVPFIIRYRDYIGSAESFESPIDSFGSLWESINGAGSWGANPWVWVVIFRRIETPIFK